MANHPIFAPTFHGDVVAVKKLLDKDAKLVAARDAKNLTPLHVAASRGQSAVAQLLLDYGADIHGPSEDGHWTPLVFAACRAHAQRELPWWLCRIYHRSTGNSASKLNHDSD